jgi:anti-anti-sigma factor
MRLNGMFDIDQMDGTVILTALTDLDGSEFESVRNRFEVTLTLLSMRDIDNVIIDLSHADYYGSSALAFLVNLWKRVSSKGGELVLCNVSKHGWEILRVTHLNRLWGVFESKDDALRQLGREQACAALCV